MKEVHKETKLWKIMSLVYYIVAKGQGKASYMIIKGQIWIQAEENKVKMVKMANDHKLYVGTNMSMP